MTLADFTDALIARAQRLADQIRRLLRERNGLDLSVEHAGDITVAILRNANAVATLLTNETCDDDLVMAHVERARRDPRLFIAPNAQQFLDMLTSRGTPLNEARAMHSRMDSEARRRTFYHA